MFEGIRARLRALFGASHLDREMDEEMAFHIDCLVDDLVRGGMAPVEARRKARLRFGSTERAKARTREERGVALLDEGVRNVRFATRGMLRSPLFFATSIVTLSLCVGLGGAAFSVVDSVLWRPLPYPNGEKLANATLYSPELGKPNAYNAVDGRTWERIRDGGPDFKRAVYSDRIRGVNLSSNRSAAFVKQQRVGAGYFDVLGIPPLIGREFEDAEDVLGGPPVVVLSNGLWTQTFGGDPTIIGRAIRLKGENHTVVGVMPASFRTPGHPDVWTPLRASINGEGGGANYGVLIRVPEGMTFEEADSRMASLQPPSETSPDRRFGLVPLEKSLSAGLRVPMFILLGATGLMLVVGCANLSGLQIARSLARQSELATRQALGGGTGVLARQIATENLLLGALGGGLGLGVAFLALGGLSGSIKSLFSLWQDIGMNVETLVATLVLTILATCLFGLVPVLQVRNPAASHLLVSGARSVAGGGGHAVRKALLVGQVAMVTALLFAAGLLVRSYGHLAGLDPGFNPTGVLAVQFSMDDARYAEAVSMERLFNESLEGIRGIPGVTSAAVSLTLPYERAVNLWCRVPGDVEKDGHMTNAVYVTPGFFQALEIPLLQGRPIEDADREGASRVVVANQAFVARYLSATQPLGARISMCLGGEDGVEIVGVVGDVQQAAGWGDGGPVWKTPTLYLPAAQTSREFLQQVHVSFAPNWIIRASPEATSSLSADVTEVFRRVDPDLPTARVAWLSDIMGEALALSRFEAVFLIVLSAVALLLAGVGLYGIVAHEVVQRRGELGLRMALGATPGAAVCTVATPGIRLAIVGFALGGVLSWLEARVMVHLIWGVVPYDPVILVSIVGILGLLVSLASFLPAARAGRLDPAVILREG